MSDIKDGGPAFPASYYTDDGEWAKRDGMTLRDYFAAKAMPFEFKDYWDDFQKFKHQTIDEHWREDIADSCYAMADAMLKARDAK